MKRFTGFVYILIAVLLLAGCRDEQFAPDPNVPDESMRLTIYTSHKQGVYEPVIREFEERTGIWVSVETGGTNELLERIAGESDAPVCDVMFGGGVENLESSRKYFAPYRSPECENISPAFASRDNIWTPFSSLPIVLIYNTKLVSPGELTGWNDLLEDEWRGKIAFADPSVSGSSYTALCTLCQIIGGEHSPALERFAGQLAGRQLSDSGQVISAVANGSFLAGVTLEETALKSIAAGDDVAMLYPVEGTSAVPDGGALILGAPHEENAKLFLDFILGKDVQSRVVRQFSRRSVREDAVSSETLVSNAELRLIDYDIAWASGEHGRILGRWAAASGAEVAK